MASIFTLNIGGVGLAVLFGIALYYFGLSYWWFFIAVMLDFLVLSALATRAGDEDKSHIRGYEMIRGWKNVVANGLIPVVIVFFYFLDSAYGFLPQKVIIYAFIASVCAITADKFASEFGVLGGEPIDIFDFKKKRKGTSGAITKFGTVMGIVAAFIVGFTYFAIGTSVFVFAVIVISGAFGNLVDSIFGHFEEKKIGNKYTSNIMCSIAGGVLCVLVLAYFI